MSAALDRIRRLLSGKEFFSAVKDGSFQGSGLSALVQHSHTTQHAQSGSAHTESEQLHGFDQVVFGAVFQNAFDTRSSLARA